jgi:hypothetical protein
LLFTTPEYTLPNTNTPPCHVMYQMSLVMCKCVIDGHGHLHSLMHGPSLSCIRYSSIASIQVVSLRSTPIASIQVVALRSTPIALYRSFRCRSTPIQQSSRRSGYRVAVAPLSWNSCRFASLGAVGNVVVVVVVMDCSSNSMVWNGSYSW